MAEAEGAVAVREAGAPVALAVADVRDAGSGDLAGILRRDLQRDGTLGPVVRLMS